MAAIDFDDINILKNDCVGRREEINKLTKGIVKPCFYFFIYRGQWTLFYKSWDKITNLVILLFFGLHSLNHTSTGNLNYDPIATFTRGYDSDTEKTYLFLLISI